MFQSKWFRYSVITVVALILVGLLFWAWGNGKSAAQSKAILKDANALTQGFDYFYQDQNRYPTTGEFADVNLMRSYVSNYPPQQYPSELCTQTFDYYNLSPSSYELRVCLPKSVKGFRAGWNVLKK